MILVQALLIAATLAVAAIAIRSRGSMRVKAWRKVAFVLLMLCVIAAVLWPDLVTWAAQLVGVGRGTDLVVYLLAIAFGFTVVTQYLHEQTARHELHRLARRIAVVEAAERYGVAMKGRTSTTATEHPER
jgi:hypothetical protein